MTKTKLFVWLLGVSGVAFSTFPAESMEENPRPLPSRIKRAGGVLNPKPQPLVRPTRGAPTRPSPKSSPRFGAVAQDVSLINTSKPQPLVSHPPRPVPTRSSRPSPQFRAGAQQDAFPNKPSPPRLLRRNLEEAQQETQVTQNSLVAVIPNDKLVELLISATSFGTPIILSDTMLASPKIVDPLAIKKVVTSEYCEAYEQYMRTVKENPRQAEEALHSLYDFFNNKIFLQSSLSVFRGITGVPAHTVIENYEADTVGKVKKKRPGEKVKGKLVHYALQINESITLHYPIKDGTGRIKLIPPTFPLSITTVEYKID